MTININEKELEKFYKKNIKWIYYNENVIDCFTVILNIKDTMDNTDIINSFSRKFNSPYGVNYYDDIDSVNDYETENQYLWKKININELKKLMTDDETNDDSLFYKKIIELKDYIKMT
jgi:hypothetical protein